MREIKYEIKRHIGVLGERNDGWRTELNEVAWNDAMPKFDIRNWSPDHTRMNRGVTLSADALRALKELLDKEVI